MAISSDGLISR